MSGRSEVDIWVDTEKKDKMIHLKCSETEKLRLQAYTEAKGFKFVSDFIRWSVDTAVATEVATLKKTVLEFNKLMAEAKPSISANINKELIKKGVKLAFQKNQT